MLTKIVPKLPDIPVMKNFSRALLVGVVAVGIVQFVPGADNVVNTARVAVAGALQKAASFISP